MSRRVAEFAKKAIITSAPLRDIFMRGASSCMRGEKVSAGWVNSTDCETDTPE